MNKKLIPLILLSSTLLVACNQDKANETAITNVSKEDAVAVVNGIYISKASLDTLEAELAQRSQGRSFPKEQLVEELVQRELLVQDATQKKLDQTPEFTERLETIRKSLLSQVAVQNYLKSNAITDAELEAEYKKNAGKAGTEYKARHILVKTEDEAKLIIVELDKGGDFVELAKSKSTGPSGPQGGDLGWFTADQMVGPFSEATIALTDEKYTTEPVQTKFGWHIILKEGTREQTPPPFESVKEQIRPALQRQKMQAFLDGLRSQAKVEILLAKPETVVTPESAPTEVIEEKTMEIVSDDGKPIAEVVEIEVTKATAEGAEVADESKKATKKATEVSDAATKAVDKSTQ
jgi:peptidyl-prolyl cis-trans isomerase C